MPSASPRILFAGTTANAAATLTALVRDGFEVVGVLSRVDAPVGRKGTLAPSPVSEAATSLQLPLIKANSVGEAEIAAILKLSPDVGIVIAYGSLLKRNALDALPMGWLNVHYSLLPAYRGAAPVQHALLNGERKTGVTIFRLDEGMDSGPVLSSEALEIADDDNSASLLEKLTVLGIQSLKACLRLDLTKANFVVQPEFGVSFAPKIERQDARLNPKKQTALQAATVIRAMNPEPMAWLMFEGQPFRVLTAVPSDGPDLEPGRVIRISSSVFLGCAQSSCLKLEDVQPSGKKAMKAESWHNGLKDKNGIRLQ